MWLLSINLLKSVRGGLKNEFVVLNRVFAILRKFSLRFAR